MEELLLSEDSATVGVVTENPELEENTGCVKLAGMEK